MQRRRINIDVFLTYPAGADSLVVVVIRVRMSERRRRPQWGPQWRLGGRLGKEQLQQVKKFQRELFLFPVEILF